MKKTIEHLSLDTRLGRKSLAIHAQAMAGKTQKEIQETRGKESQLANMVKQNPALTAPINAKMLRQMAEMTKILDKCDEIINKDTLAEPRYSDKIAAMRLKGEILGILGKHAEHVTINIGVSDLRTASEAELRAELDRIEKENASVIDVE